MAGTQYISVSEAPASNAAAITASDTNTLADDLGIQNSRGIYVGASGDVNAVMKDGNTVLFVAMAAGVVHPLQVKQVLTTNTTATSIVVVW